PQRLAAALCSELAFEMLHGDQHILRQLDGVVCCHSCKFLHFCYNEGERFQLLTFWPCPNWSFGWGRFVYGRMLSTTWARAHICRMYQAASASSTAASRAAPNLQSAFMRCTSGNGRSCGRAPAASP